MTVSKKDKDVLQSLAEQQARIAELPVHHEKAELWSKLNQLLPTRPLVWLNEIPWHELNVNDELTCQTTDAWCRTIETGLRRTLYQWRHLPADMVVDDFISCPLVIHSTGLGIDEDVDIVMTDEASDIVSRRFHAQISAPEDVEKIKMPRVTYDREATEENYQKMCDIFGGIIPVKKIGKVGTSATGIDFTWFAPWDELIRWWGVQEAMIDLVLRPQMVNDFMSRLVDAYLFELDQWIQLNVLSRNDNNTRIGSGGYGYTDELPGDDYDPTDLKPEHMWGSAAAQIFSAVSPEMHWEFALRHEMRWLERWGLTYYGCCEPLDGKMQVLRRIPNLRKVSMSPWIDAERAATEVGTDYVFSYKPSPAVLAKDHWHPECAKAELVDALEKTRGCHIEIIMKDVSTIRYQPQRLWEWEKMAMEVAREFEP
jgi:hypothetical protein